MRLERGSHILVCFLPLFWIKHEHIHCEDYCLDVRVKLRSSTAGV